MDVLYFLIPAALVLSGCGLAMFVWAVRQGQFDDMEGPRWRVIFQEDQSC